MTLLSLLGPAAASTDDELLPVWKRADGEAHVRLSSAKALPQGVVSVGYQLLAVNTALAPPEMAVARFDALCSPKTGAPIQLVHSHTTMLKFVGGTFVVQSDEPVSPPMDVALDSRYEFAAMPAVVACSRAVAMVKAAH
ncbi:MAG TPA: hypothetical protein VFZ28_09020 [Burkholderiaceae bacterium]|nr:hypothetical protein [Burkholderiaceae bacterium]